MNQIQNQKEHTKVDVCGNMIMCKIKLKNNKKIKKTPTEGVTSVLATDTKGTELEKRQFLLSSSITTARFSYLYEIEDLSQRRLKHVNKRA